ncbi:MAG: chemotaxis protein CheW [Acidobacteria bacterium]|nr:chemotaxis protein CheW [Acidobacteriota bacterium]
MDTDFVVEGMGALLEHYLPAGRGLLASAPSDAAGLSYCIFRAGKDYFAVPLELVEEVLTSPEIADVPASPPFLLGVLVRNGETLPVIDLAVCAPPLADPQYCLALRAGAASAATTIAVAVDELIWPVAGRETNCPGGMRFARFEAASRFISGRISYGSITAWALDPAQIMQALFAARPD